MKPEVDTFAELDFRELFERNGKLAVRYIETLQAVIAAQDKCIRAMTAALKDATDTAEQMLDILLENTKKGGTGRAGSHRLQSTAKGACARGNPYARSGK